MSEAVVVSATVELGENRVAIQRHDDGWYAALCYNRWSVERLMVQVSIVTFDEAVAVAKRMLDEVEQ